MVGSMHGLVGRMAGSPPCYDLGVCVCVFCFCLFVFFFYYFCGVYFVFSWVGLLGGKALSVENVLVNTG